MKDNLEQLLASKDSKNIVNQGLVEINAAKTRQYFPSKTKSFKDLTPKAKAYWPDFIKRYEGLIKANGKKYAENYDNDQYKAAWAIARIIFHNSCVKRNIPPYNEEKLTVKPTDNASPKVSSTNQQTIQKFIVNISKRLTDRVKQIVKSLDKAGLLSGAKLNKEVLDEVVYNRGRFVIDTHCNLKMKPKFKKEDLKKVLSNSGFSRRGTNYIYQMDNHSLIIDSAEATISVMKRIKVTKEQVKSVLDLRSENDTDILTRKLIQYVKNNIIKDNKISAGKHILAALFNPPREDVDFSRPLSEDENNSLAIISQQIDSKSSIELRNLLNVDYIRSLGEPVYQKAVVDKLLNTFAQRGDEPLNIWKEIQANPRTYLDPNYYSPED